MKLKLLIIYPLIFLSYSCGQATAGITYHDSGKASLQLIRAAIKATLQLDPGLNSPAYLVDFSPVKELNRKGIDDFLKDKAVVETNLDSLFRHDSTWLRYKYFEQMIIRFKSITEQKDGTILIHTFKIKASDGAIGTEILLKPEGEDFRCVKSKITVIS